MSDCVSRVSGYHGFHGDVDSIRLRSKGHNACSHLLTERSVLSNHGVSNPWNRGSLVIAVPRYPGPPVPRYPYSSIHNKSSGHKEGDQGTGGPGDQWFRETPCFSSTQVTFVSDCLSRVSGYHCCHADVASIRLRSKGHDRCSQLLTEGSVLSNPC